MRLFALQPIDVVTVSDIAQEADMTSAAIYYHFASKDEILLEGLRRFADDLVVEAHRLTELTGDDPVGGALLGLLEWLDSNRSAATVYFVTSAGLNLSVESLRRAIREELIPLFSLLVKQSRGRVPAAEVTIASTALISLLETAAASWLTEDAVVTTLGRRRFFSEVTALAARITGP